VYVITFYSFKGGVGRTLALVNVAAELALMGRKVLLVDFDLEAPGLETFDRLRPSQPHPGVAEYVKEYLVSKQSPDVRVYVYPVGAIGNKGGQLWVMPAGRRDAQYETALAKIDWKHLYLDCEGYWFFEDTKKQWEKAYRPDYVLIDSRTGHTDVEGICTRQMPDAVAVLFFPNEQNLAGLRDVCRRIRGERARGLKKDIPLHFVMSNVPDLDDEDGVLQRRLEAFHKELGIGRLAAIIHRYESVMLFNQAIFALDRPQSRLASEYRQLTEELITMNLADRKGALRFLHHYAHSYLPKVAQEVPTETKRRLDVTEDLLPNVAPQACPGTLSDQIRHIWLGTPIPEFVDGDVYGPDKFFHMVNARRNIQNRISRITYNFWGDVDVLVQVAQCRILEGNLSGALYLFNRALMVKPDRADVLFERARCKNQLGDAAGAAEDLLNLLRSPTLAASDRLRVIQTLHAIAPARTIDAVDLSPIQTLDNATLFTISELLPDTDEGQERAIAIWSMLADRMIAEGGTGALDRAMAEGEIGVGHRAGLSHLLIRARRWGEAIKVLESTSIDSLDAIEIVNLALAHWGQTGGLPSELCRSALERQESEQWLRTPLAGVNALFLWRLGDTARALSVLEQAANEAEEDPQPRFSYWRYRQVSPDQYLQDCQELRRLIQGHAIRPIFLGESAQPAELGKEQ
jgi:MinD-like ATPase involved in chromosome partitioning or flagellar assembly